MPGRRLPFSLHDLSFLAEGFGIVGVWSWHFIDGRHYWSPGLSHILGIPAGLVTPDYRILFSLIHPDDSLPALHPAVIAQTGIVPSHTFRILRPDSQVRTVMSRGQVTTAPDGRPLKAEGVVIDISDHALLARAQAERRRRERAIFDTVRAFTSTTDIYPYTKFSDEWLELVGLPEDELLQEPTLPVLKDERRQWRDYGRELYLTRQLVHTTPNLRLANGEVVPYRMVMIPMMDETGAVESWTNFIGPLHLAIHPTGSLLRSLEQRIEAAHVRSARALLDWSMTDLSRAAGVSLSTVRRIEARIESVSVANRSRVVAALRGGGIRFSLTDGATISVGKGG